MAESAADADFLSRIRFVALLARRLHETGATAPRLERAVNQVSRRLGLACESLSTPTSMLLSFREATDPADLPARHTQVIRMDPGDIDLGRMARVDAIAEQVASGAIGIDEGQRALRDLPPRAGVLWNTLTVAAFSTTAAAVAAMLKGGWADIGVGASIGALVGGLSWLAGRWRAAAASLEVVAAFVVTILATLVAAYWVPLTVNVVVIAGLIVLLPGLMLTTAAVELAQQHLVSGVARFAGALTVLLKLAFGSIAASQLMLLVGVATPPFVPEPAPDWTAAVGVLMAGFAFAVLFRAAARDVPTVVASALVSYFVAKGVGAAYGAEFGVFVGALVITVLSNLYGRWLNRPGALVRVPGIILLVPGSVGYRSLFFVFERDVYLGLDTAISMVVLLACLAGGLLFGNMLLRPRKSL
jgi:uncharacterized membrane protein YjjP (DUF1212 family)